jgi:predicted  nucleic acid-binding Zn-ribbon protein
MKVEFGSPLALRILREDKASGRHSVSTVGITTLSKEVREDITVELANTLHELEVKRRNFESNYDVVANEVEDYENEIELLRDRIEEVDSLDEDSSSPYELKDLQQRLTYAEDELEDAEIELQDTQDKIANIERDITKLRTELLTLQQGD